MGGEMSQGWHLCIWKDAFAVVGAQSIFLSATLRAAKSRVMTKLEVSQAEANSSWPKSPFMSNFCLIPGGKQNTANNTVTQKVQIAQSLWSESRGHFCRVCPWEEGHEHFQGSLTCFFKETSPPWRWWGCLKGPLSPQLCPSPPLLPGSQQRTQTMQSWHSPNCGYFRWWIEGVFCFSQADSAVRTGTQRWVWLTGTPTCLTSGRAFQLQGSSSSFMLQHHPLQIRLLSSWKCRQSKEYCLTSPGRGEMIRWQTFCQNLL